MSESNTPRTDALLKPHQPYGEVPTSLIGLARELETALTAETKAVWDATRAMRLLQDDLTATRAELERAEKKIQALVSAASLALGWGDDPENRHGVAKALREAIETATTQPA